MRQASTPWTRSAQQVQARAKRSSYLLRFFSGRLAKGCYQSGGASTSPRPHNVSAAQTRSHLAHKHQLVAFVVAVWRVAANNEALRFVDLVLDPRTAALADLVTGILALGDDALKTKLFH